MDLTAIVTLLIPVAQTVIADFIGTARATSPLLNSGIMHLTDRNENAYKEPASAVEAEAEGASAPEIEITPEMIKAGLYELSFFHPGEDPAEFRAEIVADIYRAMRRLHHKKGDA